MEEALEQYGKKSTTIGQMRQDIDEIKSPIYVACPDPPFKTSFFKNIGVNETSGAVRYFWMVLPVYKKLLENTTYSAMDIYMNMAYQLGSDWNISLIFPNGLVYMSYFLAIFSKWCNANPNQIMKPNYFVSHPSRFYHWRAPSEISQS